MMPAKARRRIGDFYAIPISNDYYAFAQVSCGNDLAVFNYKEKNIPDVKLLRQMAVAFRVHFGVGEQKSGGWYFLGNSPPVGDLADYSRYRYRPVLSDVVYIRYNGESILSSALETDDLEDWAIWLAFHVVSRIEDFFEGRKNSYVDIIKNRKY